MGPEAYLSFRRAEWCSQTRFQLLSSPFRPLLSSPRHWFPRQFLRSWLRVWPPSLTSSPPSWLTIGVISYLSGKGAADRTCTLGARGLPIGWKRTWNGLLRRHCSYEHERSSGGREEISMQQSHPISVESQVARLRSRSESRSSGGMINFGRRVEAFLIELSPSALGINTLPCQSWFSWSRNLMAHVLLTLAFEN